MAKLIMMKGLPASGKSTKAKEIVEQGNWVRVNRDLLREMLHYNKWTGRNEGLTIDAEKVIVGMFLAKGISVVVDDCNLGDKHREMWSSVAQNFKAKFEVIEVDTDWKTCVSRDVDREKAVGPDVIIANALQYKCYQQSMPFVICDIDGTIANIDHRLHYVKEDPKNWNSFFAELNNDEPRTEIISKVLDKIKLGYELIYVSGRPESYREETIKWMRKHDIPTAPILMRRSNDKRPDTEVKQEIYDKYLKHYQIDCVFDDRPSVIRMWESNNLVVNNVGNGIEF